MASDRGAFILDQITRSGRRYFTKSDHILVQCPVHASGNENRPSRKVNISNPRFPEGESFCFVCSGKEKILSWNDLAAKCNMAPIQGDPDAETEDGGEEGLRLFLPPAEDFYGVEDSGIGHLSWKGSWRGIKPWLLKKLNASLVNSRDEPRLYLPVTVDGVEVGNVQCVVKTDKESSRIKYLLSSTPKFSPNTLYPIDIAFPMAEKLGYIVVVEGARDALNLIQYGVPAVCIWGTNAWGRIKADTIAELGVKVVIAMDPDEAGIACREKIETSLKSQGVKLAHLRFSEDTDPGNLTKSDILEIGEMFGGKNIPIDVDALLNLYIEGRRKLLRRLKRKG